MLLLVGLATVHQIGITWDEPNYFTSSYSYLSWFAHVAAEPSDWWASIDRFWEQSHEAPPFFKLWAGLFAGVALPLFSEPRNSESWATPTGWVLTSCSCFPSYAAFRFVRSEFDGGGRLGRRPVSMPLIPALFGFARLGQLDGAVASMYLLAAVALYGMLVRGRAKVRAPRRVFSWGWRSRRS